MGRGINSTRLTKEYIFENVSQITIFSVYLGLPREVIESCINTGELICSPLREDKHPTCGFRYSAKGWLNFRDFAGYFWGNCFMLVAFIMSRLYKKPYDISNKEDYIKVLRHITFTFKNIFYGQKKDDGLLDEIGSAITRIRREKPVIDVVVRDWNNYDKEYWAKFGVPIRFLNLNFVYPVDQFYLNINQDPNPKYYYRIDDPCYAYWLGKDENNVQNIKLYFPKRTKHSNDTRFICNCCHIEGIYNLDRDNYDIIVLTKSTKDRLSIGAALKRYRSLSDKCSIGVINIPNEAYHLHQYEFDWLKSKLNSNGMIVSLMDNDATGKREAIWLRDNYHIKPLLIPIEYNSKDFAELVCNNSSDRVNKLVMRAINDLMNYEL